jgi:DNA-binding transcriptional ArsR family regulator
VSQHLRVLRLAGLVQEQRIGTRHLYSLDRTGLEGVREYFNSFWDSSLTAFKTALEQSAITNPSAEREEP